MKSSRIGIIGGAGPMAGLQLVQKIIQICQKDYGCQNDADFPYIMLLSYPFADMLQGSHNSQLVKSQLADCFDILAKQELTISAIACNTLHAFLPTKEPVNFINMIDTTSRKLKDVKRSLVLCTSTSAKAQIHARKFACLYLKPSHQAEVDSIILRILAGEYRSEDARQLAHYANAYAKKEEGPLGVILGCTELPLLNDRFPLSEYGLTNCNLVDPMNEVANQICEKVFKRRNYV